jgi:hypothetical protein
MSARTGVASAVATKVAKRKNKRRVRVILFKDDEKSRNCIVRPRGGPENRTTS